MTRTQPVRFPGSGGASLAARLELPDGPPTAYGLLAHCFTCSKDLTSAVRLSRELASLGIAVLRFDVTGLGESEGDFEHTHFSSNVADLVAAAEYLAREHDAPALLIGHSLGGTAMLHAARRMTGVRAIATINAPYSPSHAIGIFASDRETIEREGKAEVRLGGRSFTITRQLLDDLEQTRMRVVLKELRTPLLILHALRDETVGIENASQLFVRARHPKSFLALDEADHLLTSPRDAARAARLIGAWGAGYLGLEGGAEGSAPARNELEVAAVEPPEVDAGEGVVLARIGRRRFRTEILAGGHPLTADEPAAAGGTDTGPTPYDLLAAALGACTAMTLRMYADRKRWPLEGVAVRVRHRKVHAADDRAVGDPRPAAMDQLDRTVELEGDLEESQRARLLEIANRCPVHRTLEQGVSVTTREEK